MGDRTGNGTGDGYTLGFGDDYGDGFGGSDFEIPPSGDGPGNHKGDAIYYPSTGVGKSD